MKVNVKKALMGLIERYAGRPSAADVAFESRGRSTQGEEERVKTSRTEMEGAVSAVADEIDALDAWRDAKCAKIYVSAPTTDLGWWGCGDGDGGDGDADTTGSNHADTCPVEIARKAMIAASDRRRAL
jgi:hypothetical protein